MQASTNPNTEIELEERGFIGSAKVNYRAPARFDQHLTVVNKTIRRIDCSRPNILLREDSTLLIMKPPLVFDNVMQAVEFQFSTYKTSKYIPFTSTYTANISILISDF